MEKSEIPGGCLVRRIRIAALLLAALILCAPLCSAAELPETYAPGEIAAQYDFAHQTLDGILTQFMTEYGLNEQNFSMSFYSTGTGETYHFAEMVFRKAASTYKLPLNMVYYDMEREGRIASDAVIDGYSLPTMHYESIVNSNNEMSIAMLYNLGTFREYREIMTQFCDQEYEYIYYVDNYINSAYMLAVLQRLYDNADDYTELIGYLKQAMPGQYFRRYVTDYEIAQKYGYFEEVICDVGIIYTPEPILLAAYTENVGNGEIVLGRLAELLTEYSLYQTWLAQPEEELEAPAEPIESEEPEQAEAAEPETSTESEQTGSAPITVEELPETDPDNTESDAVDPAVPADPPAQSADVSDPGGVDWLLVAACCLAGAAAVLLVILLIVSRKSWR